MKNINKVSGKTFLTIPKKECLILYKEVLDNSHKKWEASKRLADIGEYGTATSMAIISVEELVKSIIIFFDGHGFQFRKVRGMKTIFENHRIRYFIAFSMFVMGFLGEEIIKLVHEYREKPQEFSDFVRSLNADKELMNKKIKQYALKKLASLKIEFDWFSKIDILRQDGFYCDYKEQFKSPLTISNENYNQVYKRLDKVRTIGKAIIDSFDDKNELFIKPLEKIRNDFKVNKYYDKIGESLKEIRQSGESPFDLLKRKLTY